MALWTPTSFDTYRSAIFDEGTLTLSVVTKNLYQGGNRRPDLYFKSEFGEQRYKSTFNKEQQSTLESFSGYFNIRSAVNDYDISLNYVLQEHVCGLSPKGHINWESKGTLENLLCIVRNKRNEVAHRNGNISKHELQEKLDELRRLYGYIIDCVARITHYGVCQLKVCSIEFDKLSIIEGLERKYPSHSDLVYCNRCATIVQHDVIDTHACTASNYDVMVHPRREKGEGSGIPSLGKIALGAAGGAAALWVAASLMKEPEKTANKVLEKIIFQTSENAILKVSEKAIFDSSEFLSQHVLN
ncbi:unnamed protein product [Meganyctiphanes norvegica]|uniref:Uncharacterized protein n=1 Tax=Meganyctiphanes norvegica TaxID=48144 RepID=A0AAV2RTF7_MEGNR